ncbi:MAG: hypothetical protein JJLCMIEE_00519 [Acidimicrobiales bacterium]|nr:MAG: hypothetical protein EDR02_04180 [Actinomycetota bacterium]MBV6507471.1 hypothetical protein [Acidimicrobiales bacterium]RIK07926.1 MAG: hypothetical protein DCC48_02545 [Acidobacteriota bacterium]
MTADQSIAYIGSTNISGNSMNFNRELGMVIEDAGVLQAVGETFQADFNSPDATPFEPGAALAAPDSELLEQYSQPEVAESSGSQTSVPMPCGVITVPSG